MNEYIVILIEGVIAYDRFIKKTIQDFLHNYLNTTNIPFLGQQLPILIEVEYYVVIFLILTLLLKLMRDEDPRINRAITIFSTTFFLLIILIFFAFFTLFFAY